MSLSVSTTEGANLTADEVECSRLPRQNGLPSDSRPNRRRRRWAHLSGTNPSSYDFECCRALLGYRLWAPSTAPCFRAVDIVDVHDGRDDAIDAVSFLPISSGPSTDGWQNVCIQNLVKEERPKWRVL